MCKKKTNKNHKSLYVYYRLMDLFYLKFETRIRFITSKVGSLNFEGIILAKGLI